MRLIPILPLAVAFCWAVSVSVPNPQCAFRAAGALPDSHCTPGAINHAVTQATIRTTICKRGWTATVRPPLSVTEPQKRQSMAQYGLKDARLSDYEYDHLIPLELGGALDNSLNMWPERRAGVDNSRVKDQTENKLNELVCSGKMKLWKARAIMRTDWRTAP